MHLSVVDNWRLGELVNNIHTVLLKEFASREIIANSTIYVCPGQLGVRLTIDGLHCKKKVLRFTIHPRRFTSDAE